MVEPVDDFFAGVRIAQERSASPFGRQPKPVIVRLEGEPPDVAFWRRELARRAEYKGDSVGLTSDGSFTIYPRAVND